MVYPTFTIYSVAQYVILLTFNLKKTEYVGGN